MLQRSLLLCLTIATAWSPVVDANEPEESDPIQVFQDRIMPIFRSPKPSSCVQCHLAAVDIKDYIRPSHTETFVALRQQGLINVDDPPESKILKLIEMGEQDQDARAKRIHAKARRAEYDAFSAWIVASCKDQELVRATIGNDVATIGPSKPIEVVRHARKSRVVESFVRHVWSQRMRCFPCHTPHEIDKENPKHEVPAKRHRDFVDQYGARMNLFLETPEATLSRWAAASRKTKGDAYPLLNLADAKNSLIVLKPTSKLPQKDESGKIGKPSSSDPVSHMGGLKMHRHDHSYKAMIAWIEDYASVVGDRYLTADQLPSDHWLPTQRILRVKEVPEDWGDPGETVLQLFVHSRDEASGDWSDEPIGFTQGTITPRRFVNGAIILFRPDPQGISAEEWVDQRLTPGSYQIRAYVDAENRLSDNPIEMLGEKSLRGRAVIDAEWNVGFPKAETFSASMMN